MPPVTRHLLHAGGLALWFMLLALPLLAVRVDTLHNVVEWRWENLLWVGSGTFALALLWRLRAAWRRSGHLAAAPAAPGRLAAFGTRLFDEPRLYRPVLGAILAAALIFPWLADTYQVNILGLALIFVVLGLGLNITVGLAGLLDLGYIAFFAVGAYCYALLNTRFGLGFWPCLPLGGLAGACCGLLLGFPILRLRGDYLAIVTLGFGSIARIVLENWDEVSGGAQGIAGVARPGLFGAEFGLAGMTTYLYYLLLGLVALTVFVTRRLQHSRVGRAWVALREDEIACAAMGVDVARTKLSAYACGAFWAGLVGVIFAARNTYINPNSFTFMESALVLSIVVLGGMGSIVGVVLAALALVLLPEYLRALAEYRMLVFGAVMVAMMILRPQGLVIARRRRYRREGDA
ncbi:MAG: high-affinity branched-chain amino acid ABC transporter permease LivM [Deltaproteobacteria bacterium]|nr:MAG: high-affinity branched-chain amino acid ABC transporter permease LivM [Deltaproteobacteria bacterium]